LFGISLSPFVDLDSDDDGIPNRYDACPDQAEDLDGFQDDDGCPESDNDADGIPDGQDQCPNQPEDFDGFSDNDGCPDKDNDLDGILDVSDLCPNEAEDMDGYQDSDGCPDYDNDLDGIPDSIDACPDQAEVVNGINDDDGCPDTLTQSSLPSKFVLSGDDVFFEGSAKIRFEVKNQLDEIMNAIKDNPGTKWRIEGHLDSYGSDRYIRNLSLERAKAILEYFAVFGGMDRANFEVYGMGDKFPIGNNKTDEGRSKNRRVEIIRE
jgi:outer membrane protein OmpA-like peptidoglycan-associated protein